MDDFEIGKRIGAFAEANGVKRVFLASAAGIDLAKMTKIANGVRKIGVTEYYQICKALRVPLEFFFEN